MLSYCLSSPVQSKLFFLLHAALIPSRAARRDVSHILERERGELRCGWGRVESGGGRWISFSLFLWFQGLCIFHFYLSLCVNARRSRTQLGQFATCVGGGHGARLKASERAKRAVLTPPEVSLLTSPHRPEASDGALDSFRRVEPRSGSSFFLT